MVDINMKELLEAGVHFGHQTRRWNPKMKPYIFGKRNGIYIIDLQTTLKLFEEAAEFVHGLAVEGKRILFVGTKRQAQEVIAEEARRCGEFFVTHRWLGGTLTNFVTIRASIERLKDTEARLADENSAMTKKERLRLEREREKMSRNLDGIREMTALPDALFVVDPKKESIAVAEANKLRMPVIAIVDTNCDPGADRLPDPGQRRRDPGDPPVRVEDRRRLHRRAPSASSRRWRSRRRTPGFPPRRSRPRPAWRAPLPRRNGPTKPRDPPAGGRCRSGAAGKGQSSARRC